MAKIVVVRLKGSVELRGENRFGFGIPSSSWEPHEQSFRSILLTLPDSSGFDHCCKFIACASLGHPLLFLPS